MAEPSAPEFQQNPHQSEQEIKGKVARTLQQGNSEGSYRGQIVVDHMLTLGAAEKRASEVHVNEFGNADSEAQARDDDILKAEQLKIEGRKHDSPDYAAKYDELESYRAELEEIYRRQHGTSANANDIRQASYNTLREISQQITSGDAL